MKMLVKAANSSIDIRSVAIKYISNKWDVSSNDADDLLDALYDDTDFTNMINSADAIIGIEDAIDEYADDVVYHINAWNLVTG